MADRTVQNMLNPSYDNKLVGALMMANIIEKHADGWIVIDRVWASAMVVSRNA
jgi:streptomycin 6-kinase